LVNWTFILTDFEKILPSPAGFLANKEKAWEKNLIKGLY